MIHSIFAKDPETGQYYPVPAIVQAIIDSANTSKRQVVMRSDVSEAAVNKWLKGEGLKTIESLRSLHASAEAIIAEKPCQAQAAFEKADTWED
jgi:transcriptional regulator with XRE-family HTH domain